MILNTRIIGIVGPIASGKGIILSLLQQQGYEVLSLSDVVREKTKEWGLEITRKNLQDVGDRLRKKFGMSILAEMIAPKIQKNPKKKFVIDAIRNPAEVKFFKNQFGAFVIGVTAPAEKRFELMRARNKPYDPTTWEEFQKAEERDRGVGQEEHGQQVEKCLAMADVTLENNGTLEEFMQKIEEILKNVIYFGEVWEK